MFSIRADTVDLQNLIEHYLGIRKRSDISAVMYLPYIILAIELSWLLCDIELIMWKLSQ